MTIVVDMETGHVVYVGDGKGADALDEFWKRVRRAGCHIESVATDLSQAFISAIKENLPDAVQVFDHFHVIKLMNDRLDRIRRTIYPTRTGVESSKDSDGSCYAIVRISMRREGNGWMRLCWPMNLWPRRTISRSLCEEYGNSGTRILPTSCCPIGSVRLPNPTCLF